MRSATILLILICFTSEISAKDLKCVSVTEKSQNCQSHATYNPCGPHESCYPSCGWVERCVSRLNDDSDLFFFFSGPVYKRCQPGCFAGCFCDEGFILKYADKKCIKEGTCSWSHCRLVCLSWTLSVFKFNKLDEIGSQSFTHLFSVTENSEEMRSIIVVFFLSSTIMAVTGGELKCSPVDEVKCQKHATYNKCGPNRFCYAECG